MTENEATITYSKDDLDAMPKEQVNNVMMLKPKIEGTGVVRRADGSIKYEDPSLAGTYGEENLT